MCWICPRNLVCSPNIVNLTYADDTTLKADTKILPIVRKPINYCSINVKREISLFRPI